MSYDFHCPYCGFGMNKEDVEEVHEDEKIGNWHVRCHVCKKEFELVAEPSIDYWTYPVEQEHE